MIITCENLLTVIKIPDSVLLPVVFSDVGNFRRFLTTKWMLAKRSHCHNYLSRYDRSLEIFAGDAGRFYHCVNVKTCFRAKTEFGNFRGEGTIF